MSSSTSQNEKKSLDVIHRDNLISAKEAAQIFGCSSDYIGQFCRQGKIKSIKENRSWFVDKDSLLAFKEKKKIEKKQQSEELSKQRHEDYVKELDQNEFDSAAQHRDMLFQLAVLPTLIIALFFMNGFNVFAQPAEDILSSSKGGYKVATNFVKEKSKYGLEFVNEKVNPRIYQTASILNPVDFLTSGISDAFGTFRNGYKRYENFTTNFLDGYTGGINFVGEQIADLGLYKIYINKNVDREKSMLAIDYEQSKDSRNGEVVDNSIDENEAENSDQKKNPVPEKTKVSPGNNSVAIQNQSAKETILVSGISWEYLENRLASFKSEFDSEKKVLIKREVLNKNLDRVYDSIGESSKDAAKDAVTGGGYSFSGIDGNFSGNISAVNGTFSGDVYLNSGLYDSNDSIGTDGYLLQTTGTSTEWVPASTFSISDLGAFTTDDLVEGTTTLYFTDARSEVSARNAISVTADGLSYSTSTGDISLDSGYEIPTTASTTEWVIAYNRGDHSAQGYLVNSNNLSDLSNATTSRSNLGLGSLATMSNLANFDTDGLSEGSNLYYTQSRFDSAFSNKDTDNLTEGTNLYFTDARAQTSARSAISNSATGLSYNSGTGDFSLTSGYNIPTTASTTDWNSNVSSQWVTSGSDVYYDGGNVGVGTTAPSARLHAISTTEQLRVGFDASNYWNATTNSTGLTTFDAVGSGAGFTFSDAISATGNITANSFIKSGGTSSQFLKADGSVDSNTYLTSQFWSDATGGINYTGGNIGIGTSNPTASLHIVNSDSPSILVKDTSGANATIRTENDDGTRYIEFNSTGNIPTMEFGRSGQIWKLRATGSGGVNHLAFDDNGTTRMVIRNGGNVGIGTTAPSAKLEVNGNIKFSSNNNGFGFVDARDKFYSPAAGTVVQEYLSSFNAYTDVNDNNPSDSGLFNVYEGDTYDGGTANSLFTIQKNGNVGINDTSPSYKLDVNGTGRFTGALLGDSSITGDTIVKTGGVSTEFLKADGSIDSSTYLTSFTETDTLASITGRGATTATQATFSGGLLSGLGTVSLPAYSFEGDTDTGMWSPTANTLAWSTGGVERMRVLSDGNVGIGTTAPSAKLDVVGTTELNGDTDINGVTDITGSASSNSDGTMNIHGTHSSARFPLLSMTKTGATQNPNGWGIWLGDSGEYDGWFGIKRNGLNIPGDFTMNSSGQVIVNQGLQVGDGKSVASASSGALAYYKPFTGSKSELTGREYTELNVYDYYSGNWIMDTAMTLYGGGNGGGNALTVKFGMDINTDGHWINGGTTDSGIYLDSSNNVGIGTNTPSAKLHTISTTEQLRLGFDTSNYFSTTVGSTGGVIFDAIGSGAGFTFSDAISATGNITADSFIKTGGVSTEFLKADGSVDSNTYLTVSTASTDYVPYTGATSNVNIGSRTMTASRYLIGGQTGLGLFGSQSVQIGTTGQGGSSSRSMSLGWDAGSLASGTNRVEIGFYAGRDATASNAVFIGSWAGQGSTAANAIFIGRNSGMSSSAAFSTGVGFESLQSSSGDSTVAIGYRAGKGNTLNNQFIVQQDNINSTPLIQGNFSTGNVGIGTTTPSTKLAVSGTALITGAVQLSNYGAGSLTTDSAGNVTASSDEHLKNIQGDFTRGLEDVIKINPQLYRWKESSGLETQDTYAGFVAQDIQKAIPEAVGEGRNGFLTLQDRPILAASVNAIKELNLRTILNSDITSELDDDISVRIIDMGSEINSLRDISEGLVMHTSSSTLLIDGNIGKITEIFESIDTIIDRIDEIFATVESLGANVVDGVVRFSSVFVTTFRADEIESERIQTNEICVGETCFTEKEFKEFVEYKQTTEPVEDEEAAIIPDIIEEENDNSTTENASTTESENSTEPVLIETPEENIDSALDNSATTTDTEPEPTVETVAPEIDLEITPETEPEPVETPAETAEEPVIVDEITLENPESEPTAAEETL